MMDQWFFVVNPGAAAGRASATWDTFKPLLVDAGIRYTSDQTQYPGHAGTLTVKAVENGFRNIVAVGGDGTLNEILNGICSQDRVPGSEICLTQIPVGTGNDWRKTHHLPFEPGEIIRLMQSGSRSVQDVGAVSYRDGSGLVKEHYFLNIAGLGFDAVVAAATNRSKEKGRSGKLSYLTCLFKSLIRYSPIPMQIEIDGEKYSYRVLSMNVAVCQYNGGGMKQAPHAIPDDGLFDITVITEFSKLEIVRHVSKLYDGSFVRHPKVHTFRGKSVIIQADPFALLEADGESLGNTPATFRILPGALKIIKV